MPVEWTGTFRSTGKCAAAWRELKNIMLPLDLPAGLGYLLTVVWSLLVLGFALFGCNSFWMVWRTFRRSSRTRLPLAATEWPEPEHWPPVTVQLPLYNEIAVAERIIDVCAVLDYPADKLEIQVLDDSQDETQYLARARVRFWQSQGVNIQYLHRELRSEYKAGALQWGLEQAQGKFFAIFDADFQPEPEFLRKTIGYLSRPENRHIGFVQTRWHVVNTHESLIAKSISLAINGHFAVEVVARSLADLWFGFNGSAGVWRRACIEDPKVGGWSGATLCEDLHLSYLAQLAGWPGGYLGSVTVKSDAPVRPAELRLQQFRWAKGSIQVLAKLFVPLLQSRRIGWGRRIQALLHIGSYLQQSLLLGLIVLALPMALLQIAPPAWSLYAMAVGLGPIAVVSVGQWRLCPRRWWQSIPVLMTLSLVGVGFCLAISIAVWEALRGKQSPFQRTPKSSGKALYTSDTRPLEDRFLFWEWMLTLHCLLTVIITLGQPATSVWPVALLGLCSIGLLTVWSFWDRHVGRSVFHSPESGLTSTDTKHIQS